MAARSWRSLHEHSVSCGHLEVEVPPGCYWVVAGYVSPGPGFIHLNYTTHVGITEVSCDQHACVKLYNPTLRLCWNWFRVGLQMLSTPRSPAPVDPAKVSQVEKLVEELLEEVPTLRIEKEIERVFAEQVSGAEQKPKKRMRAGSSSRRCTPGLEE